MNDAYADGPSKPKKKTSGRYDSKGQYLEPEKRKSDWDDYEVTSALSTLARADAIRANPAFMRRIRQEAQKQLATTQKTLKTLGR